MTGRWILLIVIIALGWGLLEWMLRQAALGEYAVSPQQLEMKQGRTALIGGGRAGLTFLDAPFLRSAIFKVTCKDTEQRLQLKPGQAADEVCGVRIELFDLVPGGKAAVKVSWGAFAGPPAGEAPVVSTKEGPGAGDTEPSAQSGDSMPSVATEELAETSSEVDSSIPTALGGEVESGSTESGEQLHD